MYIHKFQPVPTHPSLSLPPINKKDEEKGKNNLNLLLALLILFLRNQIYYCKKNEIQIQENSKIRNQSL